MKTIDRIPKIIDHYNHSIASFEKEIGASNNSIGVALRRKASVKDDIINSILDTFKEINPMWLLRGEGEMIKGNFINLGPSVVKEKSLGSYHPLEIVDYIDEHYDDFMKHNAFRKLIRNFAVEDEINHVRKELEQLKKKIGD